MDPDASPGNLQEQIDELMRRLDTADSERHELLARADASEAQADLDREKIVDLQAQGAVDAQHTLDLEEALKSSRSIGKAVGILMQSRGLTEEQAFSVLRQASQDSNRKVRDLAAELVAGFDVESDDQT